MSFMRGLIILVIFLQGCGGSDEHVQKYLDSGKALYKEGLYAKAKIEFKNAAQIDNRRVEAYYYIAQIDEKNQNWQGMFSNLLRVIKLDPQHLDAHIRLSRLYLFVGDFDKAFEQVELVLSQAPDYVDALVQKGTILLRQGKLKEAMDFADKALEKQADSVDGTVLKSAVYMKNKDYEAAIQAVDNLLKIKPDEIPLHQLKLEIFSQSSVPSKVEQTYLDLIKRFPDNNEFAMGLARHYANLGQDDKAIDALRSAVKVEPDNLKPKLALLDYLLEKRPEQFETQAKDYLASNIEEAGLYFRLANFYIKEKRLDEAKQALNWIVEHKQDNKEGLTAKVLLATLAIQNNETDLGTALVKQVLAVDQRHFEAMLLKANIDLINGNYDDAISGLRDIVRDYPKSDEAMVLLARAYASKNSPELASENFRKALDLNPGNFNAVLPVVSGMVKSKDLGRAEEVLQAALELDPNHPGALQAMAQVRLLKKDWAGSQVVADLIATKPKGEGFSKYLSAKISEGQGLYEDAADKYAQALAIAPDLTDALTGLVNSYEALKQRGKIYAAVDKYISAHPDSWYPVVLKGQVLAMEKRWDEATNLLASAIRKWPKTPDVYEALANVYADKKDINKIIEVYNLGLQASPDDARLRFMLASAYEQEKQYDKALASYDMLIAKQPDMDFAVNNLVSLLLDHFETKENIDRALKLSSKFEKSEQPYFLDTYGWALFKAGKYDDALQVFKNVVAQASEVAVFHYHLGYTQFKLNDLPSAAAQLEEALAIGKKTSYFPEQDNAATLLETIKAAQQTAK
jgi:tetratricopeptide (TPR) repeat protein